MIKRGFAALVVALVCSETLFASEVLYRQGFHNYSGSLQSAAGYDWTWYRGASASLQSSSIIAPQSGVSAVYNVDARAPQGDGILPGFWTMPSTVTENVVAYVEYNVRRSDFPGLALALDARNDSSGEDLRFAMRLGSAWYVSDETYAQATDWGHLGCALSATSEWRGLNFIAGSVLALDGGAAVALSTLAGDITAVGYYKESATTGTHRVDNFSIVAEAVAPPAQPTTLTIPGGSDLELSAPEIGLAPSSYQWNRDGEPISGANSATLLLVGMETGDEGAYNVTIETAFGLISSAVTLVDEVEVDDLAAYALGAPLSGAWSAAAGGLLHLPSLGSSGGVPTLTFERAREDVSYIVEASSDLDTWTTIATDPGSVGSSVTVNDSAGAAEPRRFLRLCLQHDGQSVRTLPQGWVKAALPAGASDSYLSHPMAPKAIYRAEVNSVSVDQIGVVSSPFTTDQLAAAESPYWLRIISGAQAGRYLLVTANSATGFTVDLADGTAESVALNASGWAVAAGDIIEVAPADTLATLFGDLAVGAVSSLDSDVVSFWTSAGTWDSYYLSTASSPAVWLDKTSGTIVSDNKVLRLDDGWLFIRRAGRPAVVFALQGSVPEQKQLTRHTGGVAATRLKGVRFPVMQTLADFAYGGPGAWVSSDNFSTADVMYLWDGAAWQAYWRRTDGVWRNSADGDDHADLEIMPDEAIRVLRRTAATGVDTFLSQPLPYSDPRQ